MSKKNKTDKMKDLVKEPKEPKKRVLAGKEVKSCKRSSDKLDHNEHVSNLNVAVKAKQPKSTQSTKSAERRIDFNENQEDDIDVQENNNSAKVSKQVQVPKVVVLREVKARSRGRTKSNVNNEGVNQGNSGISPGDRVQWTQEFLDKVRKSNEEHKKIAKMEIQKDSTKSILQVAADDVEVDAMAHEGDGI